MNRTRIACLLGLGALALGASACTVGVGPDYAPDGAYPPGAYGDYPPDEYIATTEPIYFDGRASYWYGNRWYYRDGARWNYYHREPAELARRRFAAPPARRTYESHHGHARGHFAAQGGTHGGGHGHH
ncbi:MAG: hypothetical protein ABI548_12430 [Polyangiaceae bacterium]